MSEEVTELKKRFVLGIIVVLLFFIPSLFIFINKFNESDPEILNRIDNKETFFIIVTNKDKKNLKEVTNVLKDKNLDYEIVDSTEESNYLRIMDKLEYSRDYIEEPTVIYVEKGTVYSALVNAKEQELNVYIENLEENWS